MGPLVLTLFLTLVPLCALAAAIVLWVSLPYLRSGSRVLTPEGEHQVSALRRRLAREWAALRGRGDTPRRPVEPLGGPSGTIAR